MKKTYNIRTVLFCSALIFLFVICYMFCNISSVAAGAEKGQVVTYDSLGYRDPMMPLVTTSGLIRDFGPASTSSDSHLEGIVYDEDDNSLAIIDGEIVTVGDVVGGMRILEIQKDGVIIQKDGQLREIKLEEE